jgi:hypothetical protein
MRNDHAQTNDDGTERSSLSPQGHERKAAIFEVMSRAARRRRIRAQSAKGAVAVAVCAATAGLAWLALAPAHPQPTAPVVDSSRARPVSKEISAPAPAAGRVVTEFVKPEAGIADRFSPDHAVRRTVVARSLTDSDLNSVLAEQDAYGLAKIDGAVLVLSNRAKVDPPLVVH